MIFCFQPTKNHVVPTFSMSTVFKVSTTLAELAYRFYLATHAHMIASLPEIKVEHNHDDPPYGMYQSMVLRVTHDETNTDLAYNVSYLMEAEDMGDHEDDLPLTERSVLVWLRVDFTPKIHVQWLIYRESSGYVIDADLLRQRLVEACQQTYTLCRCGDQAGYEGDVKVLGGKCVHCFIYGHTRTDHDVCPICLENEGIWVQLSCGHILHPYCFWKIPGTVPTCLREASGPCPMCRQRTTGLTRYDFRVAQEQL